MSHSAVRTQWRPRVRATRRALLMAALAAPWWLALAPPAARAQTPADTATPEATVAALQKGLVDLARERPAATVDERYRALEPLILATHDLPYIAEFALRRQWSGVAEADRQRFVDAFQRLSVMTYAARFAKVGSDSFRPITSGMADAAGRVQASTAIAREGQPDVTLEYLLQQGDGGWRIVNIIADGVSDLALKRAEYQRLYASGGLEGLLTELAAQTERLRAS
jgi:phospholipid transport system substrate-binding protein